MSDRDARPRSKSMSSVVSISGLALLRLKWREAAIIASGSIEPAKDVLLPPIRKHPPVSPSAVTGERPSPKASLSSP